MSDRIFKIVWLSIAGIGTSALLVNDIVNNAVFHSGPHINQTLPQIIHVLHFYLVDLLLNYALDFVVNF